MILYQHQPDESTTWRTVGFDEDDGWWVGIQKCAATVALAATLALSGAQTAQANQVFNWQQDDPAGSLKGQPEELYWQNPVAPVPATLQSPQQWTFDVQEPAGNLFGPIRDEDFWLNPVRPQPASIYQALPYLTDPEEIPANSLRGQPEEFYWREGPAPTVASLLWPQPFWDQNDFVGYTLDEDYWQNAVAPVVTKTTAQPYSDPNDFVGYTLDEDYLLSLTPRFQSVNFVLPQFDGSEIVPQPIIFRPEEDFWYAPTCMVQPKNVYPSPIWDMGDHEQSAMPGPTGIHYIPVFRRRRR